MTKIPYRKRPRAVVDIRRLKFGELTALRMAGRSKRRAVLWLCLCSCGRQVMVEGDRLRLGRRKTCGKNGHWPVRKLTDQLWKKHPAEYRAWAAMKQKCLNKRHHDYRSVGKLGVVLHEPWRTSFELFLTQVGQRPSGKHVLRRIDRAGNYEPGNVEWRIEGGRGSCFDAVLPP